MALLIKVKVEGEIRVIYCSGQVDSDGFRELKDAVDKLVERGKYRIIIDLSEVDFIISPGWGVITANIAEVKENGGDIRLAGMTSKVREVYEKVELNKLIKAYNTAEEALASFAEK